MTRRILITLGSTTDDERCGDCPARDSSNWCDTFGRNLFRSDPELGVHRCDECIAAEKAAEEVERG